MLPQLTDPASLIDITLEAGATVTFLLRKPSMFDADTAIQPYLTSGQVRIVKGDALIKDDVVCAWAEAGRERSKVDYLIFTVGTLSISLLLSSAQTKV